MGRVDLDHDAGRGGAGDSVIAAQGIAATPFAGDAEFGEREVGVVDGEVASAQGQQSGGGVIGHAADDRRRVNVDHGCQRCAALAIGVGGGEVDGAVAAGGTGAVAELHGLDQGGDGGVGAAAVERDDQVLAGRATGRTAGDGAEWRAVVRHCRAGD